MGLSHLHRRQVMQKLARKFEAEITFDFGTVIGTMDNPQPTPLSLMEEMAADARSFAAAYVDFQSRLLKPVGVLGTRPCLQGAIVPFLTVRTAMGGPDAPLAAEESVAGTRRRHRGEP